jgi:hypothetical protein
MPSNRALDRRWDSPQLKRLSLPRLCMDNDVAPVRPDRVDFLERGRRPHPLKGLKMDRRVKPGDDSLLRLHTSLLRLHTICHARA